MSVTIVSQNYFQNDNSDYANSLRQIYGNNGYQKYVAKMNSIMASNKDMSNPIAESKAKYIEAKKEQYYQALLNFKGAERNWSEFQGKYNTNLNLARANNNGLSLSGTQKQEALQNSGSGAFKAQQTFQDAEFEKDYALSLYNDATHDGMNFMA